MGAEISGPLALAELAQEQIIAVDRALFVAINQGLANPVLDHLMPFLTGLFNYSLIRYGVLPTFLIVWVWRGKKKAATTIVLASLLVAITDLFSHRLLKQIYYRPRPLYEASLNPIVRVPHRPESSSLPSNHAFNTFALAGFLAAAYPPFRWWLFAYAALMGFSRVYVGVHYPSDVVVGALLGLFFAWGLRSLVKVPVVREKLDPIFP